MGKDNYCEKCFNETSEKIECTFVRYQYLDRGEGRRQKKYAVHICPECGEEIFLECNSMLDINTMVTHSDTAES